MITTFLPCRLGSERIPNKNTKDFSGVKGGLLTIKLKQLLSVKLIDKIILSSNDPEVLDIGSKLSKEIVLDERPENLALSSTSTDDLIKYIPSIISEGHILWTHTTSPFIDKNLYNEAILTYVKKINDGNNDSLMSVNKIQSYLWFENNSFNYNRNKEKWPRTQTLKKIYEINSGIFLNSIENYLKFDDRIGLKPFLMQIEGYPSFDIDWPEDFNLAELIYKTLSDKLF